MQPLSPPSVPGPAGLLRRPGGQILHGGPHQQEVRPHRPGMRAAGRGEVRVCNGMAALAVPGWTDLLLG